MAKISVIVPTYNVANYIEKCLKSLENQTFEDFDVLVIDDGSPSNEYEIIQPFLVAKNSKFKYTRKINGGYGSVLYDGIHDSKSDFILVCDPDDWLEPNALFELNKIQEETDADIICSARYLVYSDNNDKSYDKMFNSKHVNLKEGFIYTRNSFEFNDVFLIENAPHGKLFRRSLLQNLYFPHKATNTDTIMYFGALFKASKVVYSSTPFANYLILREGNTVTDVSTNVIDGLNRSYQETLNLAESYFDLPSAFYFQMLISFHYITYRCSQLNCSQELKLEKLKKTALLLKYLKSHRLEILKYSLSLPVYSKMNILKNLLLLFPVTDYYALNKLIRNRLQQVKTNDEEKNITHHNLGNSKVSIVIPIYNVEKYLDRCLTSVKNQTYTNIEVICVDDGSTDSSLKIAQSYSEDNEKFIILTKTNGGLSDARNFGINHSSGEFLFFLDSDDWLDDNAIEYLVSKSISSQSDVVVCDLLYEYENGIKKVSTGGDFTCIDLNENNNVIGINNSACNKLYKSELFLNRKFIKGLWYEDLATIPLVLLESKRISKISKPLYHYFQRESSIVHSENIKVFDIYSALDEIHNVIKTFDNNDGLMKEYKKLLIIHGLDITTQRIRYFSNNRTTYLKKNLSYLSKRYRFWFLNRTILSFDKKKKILFLLLFLRQYKIVLWLFDRKGK